MSADNRAIIEAYADASVAFDWDRLARLRHPDWTEEWPQSGERIPSSDAYRRVHERYPGGVPDISLRRVVGAEDRWVPTPAMTIQRITGSGDVWIMEGLNRYGDGSSWHLVKHVELRDGRILREVTYFAAPFEAPEWRAEFVERMD